MGPTMKLIEAIRDLDDFNPESTIYASQPWTENSETIMAHEPDSGGLPAEAERLGLRYFLEVFVAREFVEGWIANLDVPPSPHEKCARLIEYAVTDA
jgi:hypothetical protein